jgi:FeS assembly SUF system regulator
LPALTKHSCPIGCALNSTRFVLYFSKINMFKVSRLTDYGVVILRILAEQNNKIAMPYSARNIALLSGLPCPTASKILKHMAKHKLIVAKRGVAGGYELTENPKTISLLRLIEIFEGPWALTSCMRENHNKCQIDHICPQRNYWHSVHRRLAKTLSEISLFDLIKKEDIFPVSS